MSQIKTMKEQLNDALNAKWPGIEAKQTVLAHIQQVRKLENELQALRNNKPKNLFYTEISTIEGYAEYPVATDAYRLAYAISDRDFALTRNEIRDIFKTSGFEYTEKHIDHARPDTDELTRIYRQEDKDDYRAVHGIKPEDQ